MDCSPRTLPRRSSVAAVHIVSVYYDTAIGSGCKVIRLWAGCRGRTGGCKHSRSPWPIALPSTYVSHSPMWTCTQHVECQSRAAEQQSSRAADQQISRAAEQQSIRAAEQQSSRAAEQQSSRAAEQQSSRAAEQQISRAAEQQSSRAAEQQSSRAAEQQSSRAAEQQSSSP
jgi:hypothetical protein